MKLTEIIDVEILQKIQDGFSDAFKLPAEIYDKTGLSITKPSRFTEFCKLVRSTPKGKANCEEFNARLMKTAAMQNETTTRKACALKNIITVTIPIIINEIHYANFGIGQLIDEDVNYEEIKRFAKEINVDEAELLKASKTLIPMEESLLSNSIKFLSVISEQISILGYQNLQKKELIIKHKLAEQELKIAKEEAEKSEARFDLAMAATKDGIYDWNLITNEIYYSPGWKSMLGYNDNELPNDLSIWEKLTKPEDVAESWKRQQELINKLRDQFEMEFQMKHKDGHWVDILSRAEVKFDKNGKAIRMIGTHVDISERKTEERRYRKMIENMKAGVAIYLPIDNGNDFKFLDFNSAAGKITNTVQDEVIGKTLLSLFPNMNKTPFFKALQTVNKTNKDMLLPAFYYNDAQREGWRENYIYKLSTGEIIAIFDDVTNSKNDEIKLQNKNKELIIAKEKAEKSEHKHRLLMQNLHAGVIVHAADSSILFVNDKASKLLGLSFDQLKGKTAVNPEWHFIYEDKTPVAIDQYPVQIVINKHTPINNQIMGVNRSATKDLIWLLVNAFPEFNSDGNLIEVVVTFVDITELKQAEEKLQLKEAKYKNLVEMSLQGMVVAINDPINIVYASSPMETITGYSPNEIESFGPKELHELIYKDDRESFFKAFANRLAGTHVESSKNYRLNHKDGRVRWIELFSSLIQYNNETAIQTVFIDITERKKAEKGLIESELKFREMTEMLPQIVFEIDMEGNLTYVNKQAYRLSGYSEKDLLIGENTLRFYIPADRARAVENIKLSFAGDKNALSDEYTMLRKDGSTFDVLAYSSPILKDNNIVGLRGLLVDISEIKHTQQELIIAKEKAEESDRLKSAFLANMSHEIRTPMNGILGFSDLLKEPNLSGEKQQKYIGVIEESGERMLNIINDIVSISKIESGQMEVNIQESNINEQLGYIYSFFKPELEAKGIKFLSVNPLSLKEAIIKTDREKVFAILTNLVKNAIKFTSKGLIEFGYNIKDNYLEFYVKDTGIGIPKDRQQAIFERFIQADIADRNAYQGAGLGLSISKAYVEMLGGELWVESEEGKGSCFYFTLPYQNETIKECTAKNMISSADNEIPLKRLKILIAEDDEISEDLISIYIEDITDDIISVKTGIEAVQECQNNPDIDLILMDMLMPEMDGIEATMQIRKFNKNVVIIAQTANALEGDREKAIIAGCDDYIAKPIKKAELFELINKYFNK